MMSWSPPGMSEPTNSIPDVHTDPRKKYATFLDDVIAGVADVVVPEYAPRRKLSGE